MGTLGAGDGETLRHTAGASIPQQNDARSTLLDAQAIFDPSDLTEKMIRELGHLKSEVQAVRQQQQLIQEQFSEFKSKNEAQMGSVLET